MATDSSLTNEVLNDRNPMTEHNYCKDPNSNQDEEAMDTAESQTTPTPQAPPTPHLSALSPSTDTMESILISLLRSHTQSINEREGGDKQCNNEDDVGRAAAAAGINPLSLDCLSNEQINYLITSSSVNYAAIQEMIVQRSKQYMPMTQKDEPVIMNEVRMNTPSPLPQAPPTQAPPTQAPPTLNPGTTLTITSHQLRELQSQLTSLLQQQSASIGVGGAGGGVSLGPGSQASIDALNQLLKQQLINMVTAGLPAQDITQPMDTVTTSHNPTTIHNPQSVPVNHSTSIPVTPTTVTTPTNITTPTSLPATFFHPPITQQPVTGTNTAGPQLTGSNTAGPQSVASTGTGTGTGTAAAAGPPPKKKKEQEKRIPTAFNVYFSDVYHKVIEENPNLPFSDISKIVSTMWNGLGQEGKQKYYDRQDEMKQSLANKPDTPTTSDTPPTTPTNPKPVKKQRKTSKDGVGGAEEPVKRKKTEGMCIAIGCYNRSCYNEERGYQYCSNDCIISHYKAVFNEWVSGRKQTLKT